MTEPIGNLCGGVPKAIVSASQQFLEAHKSVRLMENTPTTLLWRQAEILFYQFGT